MRSTIESVDKDTRLPHAEFEFHALRALTTMKSLSEEESILDGELRRLGAEAETRIATLRTLGEEGTKSNASELNKTLETVLKSIRRLHRKFELLAEEQETKEDSIRVAKLLGDHKRQYENVKKAQERAFEDMKKNEERAWRKKRQELIAGAKPRSQIADEKSALAASEGITESLRRTREMMTAQISQTEGTTQVIGSNTQSLLKTGKKLRSQKELFGTSRRLLNSMSWQDLLDKLVLYGGVGFFLVVVLYIVQKRMIGLTPQIVKDSVSNLVTTSIQSGAEFYDRIVKTEQLVDPIKPSEPQFDDLEPQTSAELIKTEPQEPIQVPEETQKENVLDPEEDPYLDEEDSGDSASPPVEAASESASYSGKSVEQQQQQEEDEYEDVYLDDEEARENSLILPSNHDEL